MERRHNSMGHKLSDFFLGFTDLFNLGRPIRQRNYESSAKDDAKALRSDWKQAGQYLRNAMSRGQQQNP